MNRRIAALKYLLVFSIPATTAVAFTQEGIWTWLPIMYAFGLVPLLEFFFRPNETNMTAAEEAVAKSDRFYDWLVYLTVPTQWVFLVWFCVVIQEPGLHAMEYLGRIMGMGLMCGVLGINVAHELGHRTKPYGRALSKTLLLSSLYMHFYIEHNRGHHKHASTPEDPATARRGEAVYTFWMRSVFYSFRSAWQLEAQRLRRKGIRFFSWKNEMLRFQALQLGLIVSIALVFSVPVALAFVATATVGFLLLETVNYIEHYGLVRQKNAQGKYERVQAHHSWNSNHVVGRLLLFELSRHSDHHFIASRPYQILRHHDHSPQMPTGYPGMMVLSLLPPLWFWVMHRHPNLNQTDTRTAFA
ncbi:MAG TPA: alkane 1-monooxygenase [Cytophagales bacterium]|nr:alkane 1-monooxygenase [Cytophagales bacterium]